MTERKYHPNVLQIQQEIKPGIISTIFYLYTWHLAYLMHSFYYGIIWASDHIPAENKIKETTVSKIRVPRQTHM